MHASVNSPEEHGALVGIGFGWWRRIWSNAARKNPPVRHAGSSIRRPAECIDLAESLLGIGVEIEAGSG